MNVLAIHLYLTIRHINLGFNYFGNFYRIIVLSDSNIIKRMGALAASAVISSTGLGAPNLINGNNGNMKILAINGSSRKQGTTGDMIDVVLSELSGQGHIVDKIDLAGHSINPCKACFACAGKRNCVFFDDIFRDVYERMTEADVIIMGSPTYSADVSSTLKAVIERASVVSDTNPGMFSHKIGAGIEVGRRAGTMNVLDTINRFFLNIEMFIAGSTYWNIAYGRLPGEALKDAEGVETMRNLGKNISWLLSRTA